MKFTTSKSILVSTLLAVACLQPSLAAYTRHELRGSIVSNSVEADLPVLPSQKGPDNDRNDSRQLFSLQKEYTAKYRATTQECGCVFTPRTVNGYGSNCWPEESVVYCVVMKSIFPPPDTIKSTVGTEGHTATREEVDSQLCKQKINNGACDSSHTEFGKTFYRCGDYSETCWWASREILPDYIIYVH